MLSKTSDLKEIMWNFSHFRGENRLTLKQNPHFYEGLPTSPDEYKGTFRRDPIETFDLEEVNVLTDNSGPGRVFLETAKETRAFGNVWVPKDAIIFKGSSLFFEPISRLLTPCQTSVESLRVKTSSGLTSKTRPNYGGLRSLRRLLPLSHLIRVNRHLPRHQRLPQYYQPRIGLIRFAEC
jgi:hypothetical protein